MCDHDRKHEKCRKRHEKCRKRHEKKPKLLTFITKCDMREACGKLVIKRSGNYAFKSNLWGQIKIKADNVCLDLCCFELDGHGKDIGIKAEGVNYLKIFNGSVTNTSVIGINLVDCTAVTLTQLNLHGNNRALVLSGCKSVTFTDSSIRKNTDTLRSVGEFLACRDVTMRNVDCSENRKNIPTIDATDPDEQFKPKVSIFSVAESDNVVIKDCKFNKSTTIVPVLPMIQIALLVTNSNNVVVSNCQSNENILARGGFVSGISGFQATGLIIEDCQVNDTQILEGLLDSPAELTRLNAIYIKESPKAVVRRCEMIKGRLTSDPEFQQIFAEAFVGIDSDGHIIEKCLIEDWQMNTGEMIVLLQRRSSNTVCSDCVLTRLGSLDVLHREVLAIDISTGGKNNVVRNCEVDMVFAKSQVAGILVLSDCVDVINCKVTNLFCEGLPDPDIPPQDPFVCGIMCVRGNKINIIDCFVCGVESPKTRPIGIGSFIFPSLGLPASNDFSVKIVL